jgi:DNA polymerase-3 subunit beta
VTDVETRGVDFIFNSGLLTLKSVAASVGESKVEIPIPFEGEEIVITFDVRYLADFLKALDSAAHIQLQLIDSDSAAVLKTDDGYTYVIMPLSQAR